MRRSLRRQLRDQIRVGLNIENGAVSPVIGRRAVWSVSRYLHGPLPDFVAEHGKIPFDRFASRFLGSEKREEILVLDRLRIFTEQFAAGLVGKHHHAVDIRHEDRCF